MITDDGGYLLDDRAADAGARCDGLAALFNPVTFRHIEGLGIEPGWRCWEVGAGGPSVSRWLAPQIGPQGEVAATDIDIGWVDAAFGPDAPNITVLRHDVMSDEAPGHGFDLVHARLVLVHLPDQRRANAIRDEFRTLLFGRGAHPTYGSTLPRRFRDTGLVDVGADAYMPVGGRAAAMLERANIRQIREQIVGDSTSIRVVTDLTSPVGWPSLAGTCLPMSAATSCASSSTISSTTSWPAGPRRFRPNRSLRGARRPRRRVRPERKFVGSAARSRAGRPARDGRSAARQSVCSAVGSPGGRPPADASAVTRELR